MDKGYCDLDKGYCDSDKAKRNSALKKHTNLIALSLECMFVVH